MLFGEVLDGEEAERVGLVWRCVDDDELLDAAQAMAARRPSAPPELARRVKATIADMADDRRPRRGGRARARRQLWSMDQPAFAERLAAIQARITGK